jgi:Ni2+-binding GTPase involved in maturation of urease and hydrogenase
MEAARRNARSIHPEIEIIETSCTAGNGLDAWRQWIADRMREAAGLRRA